jgi:hypothetical protein
MGATSLAFRIWHFIKRFFLLAATRLQVTWTCPEGKGCGFRKGAFAGVTINQQSMPRLERTHKTQPAAVGQLLDCYLVLIIMARGIDAVVSSGRNVEYLGS